MAIPFWLHQLLNPGQARVNALPPRGPGFGGPALAPGAGPVLPPTRDDPLASIAAPALTPMDRFRRGIRSPLFMAGLGGLAGGLSGGQRGFSPGFMAGMGLGMRAQDAAEDRALRERLQSDAVEMRRRQMEQRGEEYRRRVAAEEEKARLTAEFAETLPEEDRLRFLATGGLPAGPDPTTAMQNYQAAVQGGYEGSFFDYQRDLKMSGATTINTAPLFETYKGPSGELGAIARDPSTGQIQYRQFRAPIPTATEAADIAQGEQALGDVRDLKSLTDDLKTSGPLSRGRTYIERKTGRGYDEKELEFDTKVSSVRLTMRDMMTRGDISETEMRQFEMLIPQREDPASVRKQKINQIEGLLDSIMSRQETLRGRGQGSAPANAPSGEGRVINWEDLN